MNELLAKGIDHTEFKDGKLGGVPKDWSEVKLGDLLEDIADGGTPQTSDPENFGDDLLWVVIDDICPNISKTKTTISNKGLCESSAKLWPKDTVILSTGATIGKVGIARKPLATKQGICGLIPKATLNNEYLYQYLSSITAKLNSLAQGSTIKEVRPPTIKKIRLSLPPLSEQKEIATILTSIDEVIDNTQKQIDKLQDLKKATMNELLTRGIGHTEFKDSELGRIPKNWKVINLGNLGAFSKGKGISKSDLCAVGVPCLRYAEIYTYYDYLITSLKSKISCEVSTQSKLLSFGDIVFAGSGEAVEEIGKSVAYLSKEEAYIGSDSVIFTPQQNIDSAFLVFQLNSGSSREQLRKLGQGSSIIHIYSSELRKVLIRLPELSEQQRISKVLTSFDSPLLKLKEKLNQTQSLKKALMQDLLTGRVRVRAE